MRKQVIYVACFSLCPRFYRTCDYISKGEIIKFLPKINMEKKLAYYPFHRTSDFESAVLLLAAGAILDSVEWDYDGKQATFVLENASKCKEILDQHKRKQLWLLSQEVFRGYREAKNEIFRNK